MYIYIHMFNHRYKLIMHIGSQLDENVVDASELCTLIEICLTHGIRIEEFGVIPLWGMLERLVRIHACMYVCMYVYLRICCMEYI
jgi:hypothetical protein